MTSRSPKQLTQFDSGGDELRRVQVPDDMEPGHAVESPTGTFIVSHPNAQLNQYQISEVNTDGNVLRQFTGSRLLSLGFRPYVAVDSRGDVFVADFVNCHVLLLDSQLTLRRVIVDEHLLNYEQPRCLRYVERIGQLLIGLEDSVAVFDVLCR